MTRVNTEELKLNPQNYVPPKRTKVTPQQLRDGLKRLLLAQQITPTEHALNALVAMSAFETGHWQSCWNYNFGNVKASAHWSGQFTCLRRVFERLKGELRWFDPEGETEGKGGPLIGQRYSIPPGHPQTRFRAYPDLESGLAGWVVKMTGMYRPAFDMLQSGATVDDFVAKLKALRYFTGDLVTYQKRVRDAYVRYSPGSVLLDTVEGVQQALITLGYDPGPVDGVPGKRTEAAVKAFQRDNELTVDGNAGPKTRAALSLTLQAKA